MTIRTGFRAAAGTGSLLALALLASGCAGPTYGTDKTATEQLFEDISNMASIQADSGPEITYSPRPAIVEPPDTATLPPPQKSIAENNPNWVESPEDTRARLLAEASENQNDPGYRSPLAALATRSNDSGSGGRAKVGRNADGPPTPLETMESARRQSASFEEGRKIQKGAYSDRRRFLSDPPLTYRKPAQSAATGELGVPEKEKQRRRIANATKDEDKKWKWPWQ